MKKEMTISEFNQRFYIEVRVDVYQKASLAKYEKHGELDDNEHECGEVDFEQELSHIAGYIVVSKDTSDTIYEYDDGHEKGFIETIKEEFNIIDL